MNPTPKSHKHAALIKQWADAPEWWDVYANNQYLVGWQILVTSPVWDENTGYKLEKSAKHPDNKPKKKLIDWSKMPRGTMTNHGELRHVSPAQAYLEKYEDGVFVRIGVGVSLLRLKEQTQFTYWGGGKCPVPEGVVVETVLADRTVCSDLPKYHWLPQSSSTYKHVVGYRIIGLADGWTDVPENAVK